MLERTVIETASVLRHGVNRVERCTALQLNDTYKDGLSSSD